MKVNTIKLNDFLEIPYIDNFYSEEELADIMHELKFLNKNGKLKLPINTGTAKDDNAVLKNNRGLFLDEIYAERGISDILRLNRKIFTVEIINAFPCMKAIKKSNSDTTLISYYEDSDYYKSHVDGAVLTALTYFHTLPKAFTGGDLYLREYDVTLPCVLNRVYFLSSLIEHEVTPVSMSIKHLSKGFGRYCMSQFLSFRG